MESHRKLEGLTSRLNQESRALGLMGIEELRKICHEETERARQLRTDDLYARNKEEPSTMNQVLSQIWICKTRWTPWMKKNNFTIQRQRAVLECSTFPVTVNPREFRAPEACFAPILDCLNIHGIRWVLLEMFLKAHQLQKEFIRPLPGIAMRHGEGLRREPQSSTIPTPRFSRNIDAWNSRHRTGRINLKVVRWKRRAVLSRNCISENSQNKMSFRASASRPKCA